MVFITNLSLEQAQIQRKMCASGRLSKDGKTSRLRKAQLVFDAMRSAKERTLIMRPTGWLLVSGSSCGAFAGRYFGSGGSVPESRQISRPLLRAFFRLRRPSQI